jgi:hypothetical protein
VHEDAQAHTASPDVSRQTQEAYWSDKHQVQHDNKTVLFYLEREDLFELRTSAIPRVAALDVSLSDILLRCLGWPESSVLISIALQSEDSDASSILLQTLPALWEVIDSREIPESEYRSPRSI